MEESLLQQLIKTLVRLFVVIDAFGKIPFGIALGAGMPRPERAILDDIEDSELQTGLRSCAVKGGRPND